MQDAAGIPSEPTLPGSPGIDGRIMDAVLAGRLRPGSRLGEHQLATLFAVSRTLVREALIRLAVRRIVRVSTRRGWFVMEPSPLEARETLEARCALEYGMLTMATPPGPAGIACLRDHLRHEQRLLTAGDAAERSVQLGNFLGRAQAGQVLVVAGQALVASLVFLLETGRHGRGQGIGPGAAFEQGHHVGRAVQPVEQA